MQNDETCQGADDLMGWKLWSHKSIETNEYAQNGNLDLMNFHPPFPHHHLTISSSVSLTSESVFSFPPPPEKP